MRRLTGMLCLAAGLAAARTAGAQTQVLIVSGLGGEPRFTQEFAELSHRLATALHTRYGVPDSDVVWLAEAADAKVPHYNGVSERANIEAAMHRMAARSRPGAEFVLVLIGHGSGSEEQSKISLPGPDLTAADFVRLLAPFAKQRVAVIDLTSASGDALAPLSAPGRVVITATKSSYERNESHFGGYFIDALTRDGADADKDGRVSLLEAFRYAARETARFYSDDSRLQTEHAQLDDDGDGKGTGDPTGRAGDGMLARRFFLNGGSAAATVAANDPRLPPLYTRRFALTDSVNALEEQKGKMTAAAYDTELERLLIALARTGHEIRSIEGPAAPNTRTPEDGGRRP
jgi:hypothetical protein